MKPVYDIEIRAQLDFIISHSENTRLKLCRVEVDKAEFECLFMQLMIEGCFYTSTPSRIFYRGIEIRQV